MVRSALMRTNGKGGVVVRPDGLLRPDEDWIRERVQRLFADLMASAGVDTNRAAIQVLFYLPPAFVRAYEELFMGALRIAGEGAGAGGEAQALGKAPSGTPGSKGNKTQLKGGAGKKYKNSWFIVSDEVLELKARIDKRLRKMGKEIEGDLEDIRLNGNGVEGSQGEGRGRGWGKVCQKCGKLRKEDWTYCPDDGNLLEHIRDAG